MIYDPTIDALLRKARARNSFEMTGPGGSCSVIKYPLHWVVIWVGAEQNRGRFVHASKRFAIQRCLDLGCPMMDDPETIVREDLDPKPIADEGDHDPKTGRFVGRKMRRFPTPRPAEVEILQPDSSKE